MKVDYIVVQAGGKGTRLEHLTANKPKALVPVENLPMLFHLFRKFPDKKYVIIADYKKEVLHEYLESFADFNFQVVDANGSGTCGGVKQAIDLLPESTPFMLVWSDLILPKSFDLPTEDDNYVGISETFPCRWKYENGGFSEEKSTKFGVAGLFIFKEKSVIEDVPQTGELVRWIDSRNIEFNTIGLAGTREFGILDEYNKLETVKTRPFNKMTIDDDRVIKEPLDKQGESLAKREKNWYKFAMKNGVTAIPQIYELEPLTMERIEGSNFYDVTPETQTLEKIVNALKQLHSVKIVPLDSFSIKDAYYGKTISRISKIRDLVPFANKKTILINDRECSNVYFYKREFEKLLSSVICEKFAFIHGDCTFSNMMLRSNGEPIFIDPRGYFGHTELFGDPNYDWAKLYYSIVGNYDRFNLKRFRLNINVDHVKLDIESNGWEHLEQKFFELSGADASTVKLLHAVIWLSLTTYAWQDYDSICGAFYNGLYYLEECWHE